MKKYGLQLRVQPSQQKKQPTRPPRPTPLGFNDDDDDNDVEREISRQASKNKALKDIEEQHKKAMEEDPSVFDYDEVYDEMKEKAIRPVAHDRQERKPKYIQTLIEKAKQREREHEIVYERKLEKERSKDDHLYADKDKFVTSAYKRKLAEQAKWLKEERLRELREEKEDVTKKSDLSDFYFNLSKNVAFGAGGVESRKSEKQQEVGSSRSEKNAAANMPLDSSSLKEVHQAGISTSSKERSEHINGLTVSDLSDKEKLAPEPQTHQPREEPETNPPGGEQLANQPRNDHHKRKEDALASAKERFLARKRAKEQEQ